MAEENLTNKLTKEQKIGLVFLLSFGILSVAFGIIQIRSNLYRPFALNNSIPPFIQDELSNEEALYYRDTDFDGLNDFDELYVYTTSPYLEDTDSDGISDKQEIEEGRNPLCFEGVNCEISDVSTNPSAFPEQTDASEYTEGLPQNMQEFVNNPEVLRSLLVQSGLEESVVEKISDDDLVSMTREIFASSTLMQQISNNPSANPDDTAFFINQLLNQ